MFFDPGKIRPTITFDIDFHGDEAETEASAHFDAFEALLESVEHTIRDDAIVEYKEDEQAVWLRGQVTVETYDPVLAAKVAGTVVEWATGRTLKITCHF